MAQCAENLVLSSTRSDGIAAQARNAAGFRVQTVSMSPNPDGADFSRHQGCRN
jgi:hypothetical protein